jgi:hypothetical protein
LEVGFHILPKSGIWLQKWLLQTLAAGALDFSEVARAQETVMHQACQGWFTPTKLVYFGLLNSDIIMIYKIGVVEPSLVPSATILKPTLGLCASYSTNCDMVFMPDSSLIYL